jgi:protein tyrosine/serine phosphatase
MELTSSRRAIGLVTTGYRSDAVRLICQTAMVPRGLTGLAQDTLESSKTEMRAVFEILAKEDSYPTLVHCTQGKDRTGLVVLMMLLLAGDAVPTDAIVDDYSRSEVELVPELEERMKEIRAIGLGEDYTRCPAGFVTDTTAYLERYGGVSGYLEKVGVGLDMQQRIRNKLLA